MNRPRQADRNPDQRARQRFPTTLSVLRSRATTPYLAVRVDTTEAIDDYERAIESHR